MKIVADTATLYSPNEGEAMGITVIPVCVLMNNQTFRDYEEISSEEFLQMVQDGGIPKSSQPSLGDVLEVMEADDEEMLFLTVGDGLSGAYQTAMAAKNSIENNDHIHVINSKTLAGPLRYLARKALEMKQQGIDIEKIKEELHKCIESSVSFVVPEDFEFLKRSGRLTAITAKIGGALKLLPVLTQTKDKTRIMPVSVKRTWRAAIETILQRLQSMGVNEEYLISVSHAGTPAKAEGILQKVKEYFASSEVEMLELSPALMTHGGPGCIVIQAIHK